MKTPVELMLDTVKWQPIPRPQKVPIEPLPYATHEGILRIEDVELRVYQLSNGQRVINSEDLERFFGGKPCST